MAVKSGEFGAIKVEELKDKFEASLQITESDTIGEFSFPLINQIFKKKGLIK